MSDQAGTSRAGLRWLLIAIAVIGLAIDAYVHIHESGPYDGVKSSVLTQGDLFRAEASLAIIAALLLLIRPRRWTAVIAFLVAGGGFALVLIYQFVDVGKIGFLPDMYDPAVYTLKTLSIVGEGVAAIAALVLFIVLARQRSARGGAHAGAYARAGSA